LALRNLGNDPAADRGDVLGVLILGRVSARLISDA
jgi:hypothetical protein